MSIRIDGTNTTANPGITGGDADTGLQFGTDEVSIVTGGTEQVKVDSSGRLLVGTSSTSANCAALFAGNPTGNYTPVFLSAKTASPGNGDAFASINFTDSGHTVATSIEAERDGGTWASGSSQPTRLVFSVTADGSSSPVSRIELKNDGTTRFNGAITSYIDNSQNIGSASIRWATVYAATGGINTSDENLKQDIEELNAAENAVAITVKSLIKKFRFKDAVIKKGDDARIHVGVIAQEVEQAFVDVGLDPRRYGMFCEDTLEEGTKRLGIRYDELLAFVIAAL